MKIDDNILKILSSRVTDINKNYPKILKTFRVVSNLRGRRFDETIFGRGVRGNDSPDPKLVEIVDGKIVGVKYYANRHEAADALRELLREFREKDAKLTEMTRDGFTVEIEDKEEKI